ncbi:hypothetical protein HGRIS_003403 [Hohenbuehelia grisea]|uniref:Uncharacterized protein n=1 Tax=Hohenbuehelia grisea TaxID=104357 RepID=A0ABR3JFG3_9AGAR
MSDTRPTIFFVSLSYMPYFDESNASIMSTITAKGHLARAKTPAATVRYLSTHTPRAVVVTDEGITSRTNKTALTAVLDYARNGGTVVIGFNFPSFISGPDFDRFFAQDLGLPWKRGDYHRTDFVLNLEASLPAHADRAGLPSTYSMKAVHVKGVSAEDQLYAPAAGAMTQSHVFAPMLADQRQAAAAATKMGEGILVYIGDVNGEEETEQLVLALCGLEK